MRRTRLLVLLSVLVPTLFPFAFLVEQAEATTACCRLRADGTVNTAGSFRCNQSVLETRKIPGFTGQYEVDFSPIAADIRGIARSATLDTQGGEQLSGSIGVSNREGDKSSVFIEIRNTANGYMDAGFNVCLHKKAPLPN